MRLVLQYSVYFMGVGGFILLFKSIFDYGISVKLIILSLLIIIGATLIARKMNNSTKASEEGQRGGGQ